MSKAEKMDKIIVDEKRVESEISRLDLANKQLQYLPILDKGSICRTSRRLNIFYGLQCRKRKRK